MIHALDEELWTWENVRLDVSRQIRPVLVSPHRRLYPFCLDFKNSPDKISGEKANASISTLSSPVGEILAFIDNFTLGSRRIFRNRHESNYFVHMSRVIGLERQAKRSSASLFTSSDRYVTSKSNAWSVSPHNASFKSSSFIDNVHRKE